MAYVQDLKLQSFRSYAREEILGLAAGLLVFYGKNGAGKTNILEAVSLLSPGRGLRSAKLSEIQRQNDNNLWAVAAKTISKYGDEVRIGTGLDPASISGDTRREKRTVRINGKAARGQNALGEHISCVWLTPQMDRLFLDSSRERRRFLDRLVFGFDPGHSGRVTRYENALSQRSKLLRDGQDDPSWLGGLEQQMAETGVAIAAARLDFAARLQKACERADHSHFPLATLSVRGRLEEDLAAHKKALEVEDGFRESLEQSRARDAITGGAAEGPHKSDLLVAYAENNMAADQCSTGEQKALLTGLILAHAQLITAERGAPPLMLLDEVAAHLDEGRRAALFDILEGLNAQVWLTGTDLDLFDAVRERARFFEVEDSRVKSE